jgi:aerobic-type carbon monoxide dehydrogenase small subunit (CoxS/CutS family)
MKQAVRLVVNGQPRAGAAEARSSLADFLRDELDLTGTHVGCEHGVCGACTVLLEGEPVRACLMLAVQAEGRSIMTIEGLAGSDSCLAWRAESLAGTESSLAGTGSSPAGADSSGLGAAGELHPIQQAFMGKHGLQCGFCTPGIILTVEAFLRDTPSPSPEEIREMLAGNLCRCTGYHFIVEAIAEAARVMRPAQ